MEQPKANYRTKVWVSWLDVKAFGAWTKYGHGEVTVYHDSKHVQYEDVWKAVGQPGRQITGFAAVSATTSLKRRKAAPQPKRKRNGKEQ